MPEITATAGRTTISSGARTGSAMKSSANAAMKVSLTISLEVSLYCTTPLSSPGFTDQVSWKDAQENIDIQKRITEMTASDG